MSGSLGPFGAPQTNPLALSNWLPGATGINLPQSSVNAANQGILYGGLPPGAMEAAGGPAAMAALQAQMPHGMQPAQQLAAIGLPNGPEGDSSMGGVEHSSSDVSSDPNAGGQEAAAGADSGSNAGQ